MAGAVFDQVNIVSCDPVASIAFYRRLGVEIPEAQVWRTKTGIHHVSAQIAAEGAADLDIDSAAFAQLWNTRWRGRSDLAGRVVVAFKLETREAVDAAYADATSAGHKGLQSPYDAFGGGALCHGRGSRSRRHRRGAQEPHRPDAQDLATGCVDLRLSLR